MGHVSRKLCRFLLMFSTGFTWLSVLLFSLYWSPSLCKVFDSISSNIDEVLSINPSANVFVFGGFNIHQKDWLTYSSETDQPGELCYNFSVSDDLTQMVNFHTRIPDCDSHSPDLLNFFLSSDASICSTMAFPPLRKFWSGCCPSFHWLSIKFTTVCLVSLYNLWLFSCWLGLSSWPFERCSMGRYL